MTDENQDTSTTSRGYQAGEGDACILVVGQAGAGKTTFISHLTKDPVDFGSSKASFYLLDNGDSARTTYLIDTPGLGRGDLSDVDALKEIAAILCGLYLSHIRVTMILLLDPFEVDYLMRSVSLLTRITGLEASADVTAVITDRWVQMPGAEQERRKSRLQRELGILLWERTTELRYKNTKETAQRVVEAALIRGEGKLAEPLSLQREMVIEGKSLEETNAGYRMDVILDTNKGVLRHDIESIRDKMYNHSLGYAKATSPTLQEQNNIARRQMSELEEELAELETKTTLKLLITNRYKRHWPKIRPFALLPSTNLERSLRSVVNSEHNQGDAKEQSPTPLPKPSRPFAECLENTEVFQMTVELASHRGGLLARNFHRFLLGIIQETMDLSTEGLQADASGRLKCIICDDTGERKRSQNDPPDPKTNVPEKSPTGTRQQPREMHKTQTTLRKRVKILPSILRVLSTGMWDDFHTDRSERRPDGLWFFGWEVPRVLENTSGDTSSVENTLSNFITLYGSGQNYGCNTVPKALSKLWSDNCSSWVIRLVCQIVRELLQTPGTTAVSGLYLAVDEFSQGRQFHYFATFYGLLIDSGNCLSPETFDAISWLCAAVRSVALWRNVVPESSSLPQRSMRWNHGAKHEGRYIDFVGLRVLKTEIKVPTESSCWLKLFSPLPVVETMLSRDRGVGLEIPLELMVTLACIQNIWTIDGATVLLGFFTALVPTEIWNTGVQWHFEEVPKGGDGERSIFSLKKLHERMSSTTVKVSQDQLQGKSCFVGWLSNANVMLGTQDLVQSACVFSETMGLQTLEKTLDTKGYEAGGQVALPGTPLVAKLTKTWEYSNQIGRREPPTEYRDALVSRKEAVCLLLDTTAKRAWLVPLLSLLLHLCHRYYQYSIEDESNPRPARPWPVPFAEPSSHGGAAAFKAMSDSGDDIILGDDKSTNPFRLSQLFHRVLFSVSENTNKASAPFVLAHELMDVILHTTVVGLKKIPLNKDGYAWPDLANFAQKSAAVVVCGNMGQVFQPVATIGRMPCSCSGDLACCSVLPKNRSYLAAHVQSLKAVCNVHDMSSDGVCRISQGIWTFTHDPWNDSLQCRGYSIWSEKSTATKILQNTVKTSLRESYSKLVGFGRTNSTTLRTITGMKLTVPEHGVVVFGRWRDDKSHSIFG